MESISVKVKKLHPQAVLPRYMTQMAAGMDLFACLDNPVTMESGERTLIPAGFALAIPPGFEGQVRPRSGLALKQGLTLVNSPGTIDADYRGEVGVILINHGRETVTIAPGDRIAQLVIAPVYRALLAEVDTLDATVRESGGFGHTGVNGA